MYVFGPPGWSPKWQFPNSKTNAIKEHKLNNNENKTFKIKGK